MFKITKQGGSSSTTTEVAEIFKFPMKKEGNGKRNEGVKRKVVKERRERKRDRVGAIFRKEEGNVYEETKVISLLLRRKIFFSNLSVNKCDDY